MQNVTTVTQCVAFHAGEIKLRRTLIQNTADIEIITLLLRKVMIRLIYVSLLA
jgi:hypothetical protein